MGQLCPTCSKPQQIIISACVKTAINSDDCGSAAELCGLEKCWVVYPNVRIYKDVICR